MLLPKIAFADLRVEGPVIVKDAQTKQPERQQIKQAGPPFTHVKSVNPEETKEGEQDPGDGIIDWPRNKAAVCLPVHRRNQEQIDNPPDEEEAAGEKPNGAGDRFAIIEPM